VDSRQGNPCGIVARQWPQRTRPPPAKAGRGAQPYSGPGCKRHRGRTLSVAGDRNSRGSGGREQVKGNPISQVFHTAVSHPQSKQGKVHLFL